MAGGVATRVRVSEPLDPVVTRDEGVTARRDRVRWSAVWAGLVVAVGIFLLLQLALIAGGAIELGAAERSDAWWTAGAALIGFFAGGLTTGATSIWNDLEDGALHGIVVWALGVVVLLGLSVLGGGVALGALDATDAFEGVTVDLETGEVEGIDTAADAEAAEDAAGWALLGLAAALAAAVGGGVVGSLLWPRREEVRLSELEARDR